MRDSLFADGGCDLLSESLSLRCCHGVYKSPISAKPKTRPTCINIYSFRNHSEIVVGIWVNLTTRRSVVMSSSSPARAVAPRHHARRQSMSIGSRPRSLT
jgi:hypothetical protein